MRSSQLSQSVSILAALVGLILIQPQSLAAESSIRSQAIVDLAFDSGTGEPGNVKNGAARVDSPFWAQSGKTALRTNAAKKHFVELAGLPYLDRPDGVTLSLFFLNLHPLNDEGYHGIVAKRSDGDSRSNYGINYNPKADSLAVYVNDGSGFRSATYSTKNVIAYRRLVHLTATIQLSDAPAPDYDTDKDDLRIRLFLNGKQIKPASVTGNLLDGDDAWIVDIDAAGILNDAPVTIGSSTPNAEYTSGVFDEFLLFRRALTQHEAGRLFREIAGPDGSELARLEANQRSNPPAPQINVTSLNGLQTGTTTKLVIQGNHLLPDARVILPIDGLEQTVAPDSRPNRLVVDLTLPPESIPGYYPLSIETKHGISNVVAIAVDQLKQLEASTSSAEAPSTVPAAFSGTLSGTDVIRVYFQGSAGDKIVADVDAKRLGATLDPVIEIKRENGTPLVIEWAKVSLRGDARAELVLPADGLYFVELHDLAYKARGRSPFRLKIGDIKIIDAFFPPAIPREGQTQIEAVGTGLLDGTVFAAQATDSSDGISELVTIPPELSPTGPAPAIRFTEGIEILETKPTGDEPQKVDALFATEKHIPVTVNGRISTANEDDRYLVNVTPGQKLNFSVAARSIDSPLDGQLTLFRPGDNQLLSQSDDRPGTRDPGLTFDVPADMKQVLVSIRDLHGRGGPLFLYRLQMLPAGQGTFDVTFKMQKLSVAENGAVVARLEVKRSGYRGEIKLRVDGDDRMIVLPERIPASSGKQDLFVTLWRTGGDGAKGLRQLRLLAESVGLNPPLERVATFAPSAGQALLPGYEHLLPAEITEPVNLSLSLADVPAVLFRGLDSRIGIDVLRTGTGAEKALELSLLTNEKPRRGKPKVQAAKRPVSRVAKNGQLNVKVPLDVAAGEIDFVVKAELKPHAYSPFTQAVVHSIPFRIPVRNAVTVELDKKSMTLIGGRENTVRGTVKRTPGFTGEVVVVLADLPPKYSARKVTVAPGQDTLELLVTAPEMSQPQVNERIRLIITNAKGRPLVPERRIRLDAVPPTKAKQETASK